MYFLYYFALSFIYRVDGITQAVILFGTFTISVHPGQHWEAAGDQAETGWQPRDTKKGEISPYISRIHGTDLQKKK